MKGLWLLVPVSLVVGIVTFRGFYWLGSIGIGWVLFLLFGAGVTAFVSLNPVRDKVIKWMFRGIVVGAVLTDGIFMVIERPTYTASQVKTIANAQLPASYVPVSAEYKGSKIWEVKYAGSSGMGERLWDEQTGKWKASLAK